MQIKLGAWLFIGVWVTVLQLGNHGNVAKADFIDC